MEDSTLVTRGDATEACNYRPIAILSNFAKVYESIFHKIVYVAVSNVILPRQHGFIHKRSTVTNLSSFSQNMFDVLEGKKKYDIDKLAKARGFLVELQLKELRRLLLMWTTILVTKVTLTLIAISCFYLFVLAMII